MPGRLTWQSLPGYEIKRHHLLLHLVYFICNLESQSGHTPLGLGSQLADIAAQTGQIQNSPRGVYKPIQPDNSARQLYTGKQKTQITHCKACLINYHVRQLQHAHHTEKENFCEY